MPQFYPGVKLIDSQAGDETPVGTSTNPLPGAMYIMDSFLLDWVPWDGAVTGGSGGGPATIADGADVAQGARADVVWDGSAASATRLALAKYAGVKLEAIRAAITGTPAVSVSNFPATQAISAAALPLPAGAATELGNLATIAAKDFATQVTLAAVLAKIIAAPATEAKQDTGNASLASIAGKDFATQATLAAVLAKIIAAPATEAKQDAGNASLTSIAAEDFATQVTLAAVLAQLSAGINVNTGLVQGLTDAQLRATDVDVIVTSMPPISASSSADVLLVDETAGYMIGDTGKNLTQTPDGKLRVVSSPAEQAMEFFVVEDEYFMVPDIASAESLWEVTNQPWS